MCGIFGYFCRNPVNMQKVLKLLQNLEKDQCKEQGEKTPVGGHGAGVSFFDESDKITVRKVGKKNASPASDLSAITEVAQAQSRIILAHVRRASNKFMRTVKYSQATQPYEVNCLGLSEIISAHNGYVKNYMSIKNGFKENHQFESKKVGFVDSEVIPHLFEESLMQHNDGIEARKEIFETIKGDNTIILLFTTKSSRFLHVLHKGQTRGMYVWKNNKGEIILCSREAPLLQVFEDFLEKSNFNRVLSINRLVDTEEQQTYEIRGL